MAYSQSANTDSTSRMAKQGFTYTGPNKDIHTPVLTNTDNNLERGSYKIQKLETGGIVTCLQYDHHKIVTGLSYGSIHIYNKQTLQREHKIQAHSKLVRCLQFNQNILMSGSDDKTVRIWLNDGTYELLNTLKLDYSVWSLKCNFNNMLVTVTAHSGHLNDFYKGQLSVWRIDSPTDVTLTKKFDKSRFNFCVDFDDTHIVNGKGTNIQAWSTKSLELLKTLKTKNYYSKYVLSLQLKNNLVVSGSKDKTVRIWDIETGQCLRKMEGHTSYVTCVRFDDKRIVSASKDKTIKMWDLAAALDNGPSDRVCIRTLTTQIADTNFVLCLQFDETQIISGSGSKAIIWNF